jgi:hypothetical protein
MSRLYLDEAHNYLDEAHNFFEELGSCKQVFRQTSNVVLN